MKKRLLGIALTAILTVALSTVSFATDYTATYDLATEYFAENNTENTDDTVDGFEGYNAKQVLYLDSGNYLITGTASSANEALTIEVNKNATVTITLQDVKLGASTSSSDSNPTHNNVYRNLINIEDGANVTLNLEGDNSLYLSSYRTPKAAIRVAPTASLTINDGEGSGIGSLSVTSANAGAAIGGNGYDTAGVYNYDTETMDTITYDAESNGTITINSGIIAATKTTKTGPAIGGGYQAGNDGDITIAGGTVTATGFNAAAIGSGYTSSSDASTGTITIQGGAEVNASTSSTVSIGGVFGTGGAIVIEDTAKVTAAGIGYADGGNNITIQGDAVVSTTTTNAVAIGGGTNFGTITIGGDAKVTASSTNYAAIGGAGTGTINISGGAVEATGGANSAAIGTTGSGTSSTATVDINISGGTVTATGGTYGAGIGGGDSVKDSGTVTISGGTVTATGGTNGAGIGAGNNGNMSVTITGGNVTATGTDIGADIGGTINTDYTGTVTISGGVVTATANGIGRSSASEDYELTFSTGSSGNAFIVTPKLGIERASMTATTYSGIFFIDAFGDDYKDSTSSPFGAVYGTPTLSQSVEIPSGKTLTIGGSNTLTIASDVTLTNSGTLSLSSSTALSGEGTLAGTGTFQLVDNVVTDTMIAFSEDLPTTYDGKTYALADGYVQVNVPTTAGTSTIMDQTFTTSYDITVGADGDVTGWTRTMTLGETTLIYFNGAGTYTVTYTNDADSSLTASNTYSLGQASVSSATLTQTNNAQYYGETVTLVASAFGIEMSTGSYETVDGTFKIYNTVADGDDVLLYESETDNAAQVTYSNSTLSVGTHTLYAVFTPSDSNYLSTATTSADLTVTVAKNAVDVDNGISALSSTYDGSQKTFLPAAVTSQTTDSAVDYTISYKLTSDTEGDYSETPPTMVDAGVYELSYLIQAEGYADYYGTATYTITIATNNITPTSSTITKTYNGAAQDPGFSWTNSSTVGDNVVTIFYSDAVITDENLGSSTPLTYTNADTYTIYYKITAENHTDDSGSFTFTIDPLNVTQDNYDSGAYTIIAGNVSFDEPTFQADGITTETITGTLTYTYSPITTQSYDNFITEMNKLTFAHGTELSIGYIFTATGNYTGTIFGTMTTTVQSITFEGDIDTSSSVTYGETWADILSFTQSTYSAAVGEDEISGTYTLLIDDAAYTTTDIPAVGDYDWTVTFTSTDGTTYAGVAVDSGTVTVDNATMTDPTTAETVSYTGAPITVTAPTATTVNGQTVTVTYVENATTSYTDAGTYTIGYTLSADNHTDLTGTITFTIEVGDSTTDATVDAEDATYTYGDTITLTAEVGISMTRSALNTVEFVLVKADSSETALGTATVSNYVATLNYDTSDKLLSVGDNTIKAYYSGSVNLNGSTSSTITVTLEAKDVTAAVTGTTDKSYDGTTTAAVAWTVNASDLVDSNDEVTLTATATYASPDVDTAIAITFGTPVVSGAESGYYTVTLADGITGDITKTTYTDTTTATGSAMYGNQGEISLSAWTDLLNVSFGTVTADNTAGILMADSYKVEDDTLVFTFANDSSIIGDATTITVPVTTQNYSDFAITATVTATAKTVPVLTVENLSKTYDGDTITIADISKSANTDGSWAFENGATMTDVADSGTYTILFTPSDPDIYESAETTATITITQAPLTITADDQSAYNGYAEPSYTYTVTGLVRDETLLTQPTVAGVDVNMAINGTYVITASGAEASANYTIVYVEGTLTITTKSISSGGGSSSTVTPDEPETETDTSVEGDVVIETTTTTTTDEDGSVTTETVETTTNTTTGAVVSTTTTETTVESEDGTVTTNITSTVTTENGTTTEATLVATATEDSTQVTIPQNMLETVATEETGTLSVQTDEAQILLDVTATNTVASAAIAAPEEQIVITVEQVDASVVHAASTASLDNILVIDLTISVGGTIVSDLGGGTATVSIPYTRSNPDALVMVYYVADDGTITALPNCSYDEATGLVTFTTTHFSYYMIAELTALAFTDVALDSYYYSAIQWAVDSGITAGISETTFGPDMTCTRAHAVTFLWRAAGEPVVNFINPFTDVDADDYYYEAVLWAMSEGITAGTSATTFTPDATCTRDQIVTFLYRAAGQPDVSGDCTFTDVDADAYYHSPVIWAVEQGITAGTGTTTFSPSDNCTRGQIVTFLYRNMAE